FGVRRIMDHLGADYADAIVFGDAMNDVSMFVDGWYKVAMGNACDEVKALADYITTDVITDGIWNACEYLGLFEPVDE
ncbi:MAG: HAD hydrolase family protein, partial [Coriobacteriales bacterium]|nr:HAD hydrolase family protein [Coriobacteriales bacterium]